MISNRFAILMVLVAVVCLLVTTWPARAQDYGEPVGAGTVESPLTDGFGPLPLMYQCPEIPIEGVECVPGQWYFGSLFGDTAYDNAIKDAAAHRRYKADWDTCEEEKRRIETGKDIQLDARAQQLEKAELRAYRAEQAQPILFGVGMGIGVAVTVLVAALVERSGDETVAAEAAFVVRW